MEKYSREKIEQRMLKRIVLLWDIPDLDRVRDIHRYILTSQDRIFTKHDIINFCKVELAGFIDCVEVKRTVL